MIHKRKILYSLDDVAIMPARTSYIKHRSECKPFNKDFVLPIFTAPMPTVVDKDTYSKYILNKINPIIPRTESIEDRLLLCKRIWCAFSLEEFEEYFLNDTPPLCFTPNNNMYILIDVANGHMDLLTTMISKAKQFYGRNMYTMIGNIANPETYKRIAETGNIDYVRLSIGSGSCCTTTTNLGIYYPMASLIEECYEIKKEHNFKTQIIADGGIRSFRDIIKCLALGADYVMLGTMLASLTDSPSKYTNEHGYKCIFGMASEKGKECINSNTSQPSEGKELTIKTHGTIQEFSEKLQGYIKSALSYCNKQALEDFIGNVDLNIVSYNASKQFNQ